MEVYYLYTLAGAGLEPATPLWGAPAYETGEIPTSQPRDFKNLCLFRMSINFINYNKSKLPVNLSISSAV